MIILAWESRNCCYRLPSERASLFSARPISSAIPYSSGEVWCLEATRGRQSSCVNRHVHYSRRTWRVRRPKERERERGPDRARFVTNPALLHYAAVSETAARDRYTLCDSDCLITGPAKYSRDCDDVVDAQAASPDDRPSTIHFCLAQLRLSDEKSTRRT